MKISKVYEGVPFYVCESPPEKYRDWWEDELVKEMRGFLGEKFGGEAFLRGISDKNLEFVASKGCDDARVIYETTYVAGTENIGYVYSSHAGSGILIYHPTALEEMKNDPQREWGEREFNRHIFLLSPKHALQGIIDLRPLQSRLRRLRNMTLEDLHPPKPSE